jgi:hypothetical protein
VTRRPLMTHTASVDMGHVSKKRLLESGDAVLDNHIRLHRVSTAQLLKALHNDGHFPAYVQIGISTTLSLCAPAIKTWRELADWVYPHSQPVYSDKSIYIAIARLRQRGVMIHLEMRRGYYMDAVA